MKTINVTVRDKIASAVGDIVYICGNSDYVINFDFDAEWDDYDVKTARFVHDGSYIDVVFTGNQCAMPVIYKAYGIYVGVYAGDLRTTTPAHIPSAASILSAEGMPAEPPDDVYAQITALCEDSLATAKRVRNDADAGKFNGAPGKTPVAGKDYFTEADMQAIAEKAAEAVGYPKPTSADDGKSLRVVEGKAKWEDVSWDDLKNKPFYLEKTLFIELTKDDFWQDGESRPLYTSTPKLNWIVSIDNVAIELNIVDTDGNSYTITENSPNTYFEKWQDDSGEHVVFSDDDNYDILSGPEDSFSIIIYRHYEDIAEIHLKLYRLDIKKIPGILVDAAIGGTELTVAGYKYDETTDDYVFVKVPKVEIPISPDPIDTEDIYYDLEREALRTSGRMFPYGGIYSVRLDGILNTEVGGSNRFTISQDHPAWGGFDPPSNSKVTIIDFVFLQSQSESVCFTIVNCGWVRRTALGTGSNGRVYLLDYTIDRLHQTLTGHIKCIH